MKRTTIDYGIDLGTTNSAIVRVDAGTVKIIKSKDFQKDTTASAVAFNKKGSLLIGEGALVQLRDEFKKKLTRNIDINSFIEFKRTMGTDEQYYSRFKDKNFSPEALSAEILKYLKGYIDDDSVSSAVITIPAAYTMNQIDAVRRAAELAGLQYVQTLQEPVAAAMAYGVENKGKDGFWLVFDFGGGTFDAALVKVEEGIVKVIDSSGDNYLGGKDLDFAIVDNLIIPHIQENYEIDDLLNDSSNSNKIRQALKFEAERLKNQLSFEKEYEIYVEEGEFCEDDDGEDIEIELTVNQESLKVVLEPIFQRAIDITLDLLKRNNLSAKNLQSLVLVGGPTLSPILRDMLENQICKPDTSVDPMTVVARGAAIYASTIQLPEQAIDKQRDRSKVQLGIEYAATSVEAEEFVTVKVLTDKSEGDIPDGLVVQIANNDGSWTSQKAEIDEIGDVVDVLLNQGKTNNFSVNLFDNYGNRVECEPTQFTIIQGSVLGGMPLPHHIGIEILKAESNILEFSPLKGLEKNTTLPATGTRKGELKTQKDIRPGMKDDFLKIPLYQGEYYAEGTRAINNEHIYDVIISGNELPKLLPAGSTVEVIVSIDQSQKMSLEAFFPYFDFTYEVDVPTDKVQSVSNSWLDGMFSNVIDEVSELDDEKGFAERIELVKAEVEANAYDTDAKVKARNELREILRQVDKTKASDHWPAMERKLNAEFKRLETANSELGDGETTQLVNAIRDDLDATIRSQDVKSGQSLLEAINGLFFQLTRLYQFMGLIRDFDRFFDSYQWKDRTDARNLINQGLELVEQRASEDELFPVINHLFELLPDSERSKVDDSVLVG